MTNDEIQESLYNAAKADDRQQVGALLKKLILTDDRPKGDHGAFSVTIDLAAGQMATLSLLVLSLQGSATGLFRYLAETHPDDIRRMAPPLVEATGNMLFVGALADMGVPPADFGPRGQEVLLALKQRDIAAGNLGRLRSAAKSRPVLKP